MEKRIYYHDTDAGGVVYYANYLKYLEEARTEFLEEKGLGVEQFRRMGFLYAVRKCSLTYKSPARYGDTVVCDARLTDMTAAQLVFEQRVHDKATGRLLVEAQVTLVSLRKDFKPAAIPDEIRAKLQI
ncbi:MAG: YbgC/FadM family acyl-CoA thioesterase [Candidatus Omnitrophica bacterium]|nr:YbgC/FadM family acyl-CoA thioesterase [Candidatus Omnitrophota bacterium]